MYMIKIILPEQNLHSFEYLKSAFSFIKLQVDIRCLKHGQMIVRNSLQDADLPQDDPRENSSM